MPSNLVSIGNSAFQGCTSLESIVIPNEVATIPQSAFSGCTSLKEATLGEGVTTIQTDAFKGLDCLSKLTVQAAVPPTIASASEVSDYPTILVPNASVEQYKSADYWKDHELQILGIEDKTDYVVNVEASETMSSIHSLIGEQNLAKVLTLKINGTINSYDIMVITNKMPILKKLDLSEATILANSYEYHTGICSHNNQIDGYAFPNTLNTLILPNNLQAIGAYAFIDKAYLTSIGIPQGVTSIGNYAFSGCSRLKSISALGQVTGNVGSHTFENCSSLDNVILGDVEGSLGKGNISSYAFSGCSSLKNISINDGITSISSYAFNNCISLTDVVIPNTVTYIAGYTFSGCSSIETMSLPFVGNKYDYNYETPTQISAGVNEYQECATFASIFASPRTSCNAPTGFYTVNTQIYDPTYVVSAGTKGYWNPSSCKTYAPNSLKKITITKGNKGDVIPPGAFAGMYVQTIILPTNIKTISERTFYKSRIVEIECGSSSVSVEKDAFYNCSYLTNCDINLGSVGENAFAGCSQLQSVSAENVKSIANNSFEGCTSLTNFVLGRNSQLTSIPDYAFSGCSALERVDLPISIKTIGAYALQNCTSLTEVKLPSAITSIGNYAFSGCSSIKDVYTYTIEPQAIDQNTFSTYTTATLHCPAVSYYNYYYDTQWSQFLKLVNFDEPYEYVCIEKDFDIYTETAGTISGKPRMDIGSQGGVTVKGETTQALGDVHVTFDVTTNKGASLIGNNNLTADNLYVDINVKKDYWHFFCFPFDIDLTKVQKEGSYIFRRYDSGMRAANGSGGWQDITGTTLEAGKGYIFRTNTAGVLSIPVANPNLEAKDVNTALSEYDNEGNAAEANKNWNFCGNRYLSYYDINDMSYTAPVVVWNGTTYVAYRPGDDSYTLTPFQAFFVQKPTSVVEVGFDKDGRTTYLRSLDSAAKAKKRMAKAKKLNQDRKLIDLTLTSGDMTDNTRVVFNEKQSMDYEMGCDASKFFSSEAAAQIYTQDKKGTTYAINERPLDNGEVCIGFVAKAEGEYTLEAKRMDVAVLLYDDVEGVVVDLSEGAYTFTSKAGTYNKRFTMVKKAAEDTTGINGIEGTSQNAESTFDLSGRKVVNAKKGLYIKNGKKVMVK